MKKINLSNWSINLLKNDNPKWYKSYVLGERENEFAPYFAIGECFANCMDSFCKTGNINIMKNLMEMEEKFDEAGQDKEKYYEAEQTLLDTINNFKVLEIEKPLLSEEEVIIEINDKYNLKCRFDALYKDYILDHKTVSSFTNEDQTNEKYGQQIKLYQYAWYKQSGEKLPGKILEIKKGKASIPRDFKKADLQALVPENMLDKLKTVNELKDYIKANPPKQLVGQFIEFKRDENLIDECEELIKKAMIKADWLQTISIDDIL